MSFRLKKAEFEEGKADGGNKAAMRALVLSNQPTGLLGIYEGQAIAWCAFAPREHFLKLENSRVHRRIDDKFVWSVPCTFIDKNFRRLGVSVALLKGLINYAREKGINIIEAYPTIPTQDKLPDAFAWIGLYKSFERAGFEIVDHTSASRPMVRFYLTDK
jgi:GNAT superfamily N-acetyltransferase